MAYLTFSLTVIINITITILDIIAIIITIIFFRVANRDLLTVNRYRLSASPDYFVPNKTLYADYVAFIKELPGVEDHRWTMNVLTIISVVIIINYIMILLLSAFNVTGNSWRRRQEALADQLVEQVADIDDIMMMIITMTITMTLAA